MQSAFVNIGLEKDAFLYVSDFVEENEDCDQVFTAAEEQMDTAIAEVEVQERPQRRERKGDRSRWRETERTGGCVPHASCTIRKPAKKRRPRSWSTGISAPKRNGKWNLVWNRMCSMRFRISRSPLPSIPACQRMNSRETSSPVTVPAADETGMDAAAAPEIRPDAEIPETSSEDPSHDSASIRDEGETLPFSADQDGSKPGFARRRGAATRRKRYTTARNTPRPEHQSIDDMLQEGQEVLVQVAKEPIAKKGARVTSHIALPGRYLVYMPTVDHVGVSRKIGSDAERIRLKEIILRHRDRFPGGVIVRTAAEEHSEEDLVNDLTFLVRVWEDMRSRAEKVSAPALIHAEMNLVQRLLRDQFSFEFAAIRVDDEMEYQRIVEFVDKIFPNLVHRVKLYTKENYIFDEYGITPEIDKLLQPKIWLKSGGYIVINQTEALVSIDINTGKFVGRGNSLEETITRTNLEAVKEIVRQIRLRDLGGIIVIDFIDMDERKNRKRVMEALSEEIARDKSPSKILEFNEFGLGGDYAQASEAIAGARSVPAVSLLHRFRHGEIHFDDLLRHLITK